MGSEDFTMKLITLLLVLLAQPPDKIPRVTIETQESSAYGRYAVTYQGRNIYVYGTKLPDGNIMWFPDQQAKLASQFRQTQQSQTTTIRRQKVKDVVTSEKSGRELIDEIHAVSKNQGQYDLQKTAPGSPAEKKFGGSVRAPDPPGANICPGCGKPYEENCKCGFKFSWDNTPEQWKSMLKVCPTCRSPLTFTNGCVQCGVCPFLMVIDQASFDASKMRNPRSMYIPQPHDWQVRESQARRLP
jgi:hypothetical protein